MRTGPAEMSGRLFPPTKPAVSAHPCQAPTERWDDRPSVMAGRGGDVRPAEGQDSGGQLREA